MSALPEVDLAFIAMAQQKFARTSAARETLEQLRAAMMKPANANNEELQGFLRKTEVVVGRARRQLGTVRSSRNEKGKTVRRRTP